MRINPQSSAEFELVLPLPEQQPYRLPDHLAGNRPMDITHWPSVVCRKVSTEEQEPNTELKDIKRTSSNRLLSAFATAPRTGSQRFRSSTGSGVPVPVVPSFRSFRCSGRSVVPAALLRGLTSEPRNPGNPGTPGTPEPRNPESEPALTAPVKP